MTRNPLVLTVLALALITGTVWATLTLVRRTPTPPPNVSNRYIQTTVPVETRIIRQNLPGKVDTVYVNNQPAEYASHSETIEKDRVSVDLDVGYNEGTNLFDIRANVTSLRDSVYVEKIIDRTRVPKLLSVTTALGVGFSGDRGIEPDHVSLDLGLKFRDKYRITAFGDTHRKFGLRLGVDF